MRPPKPMLPACLPACLAGGQPHVQQQQPERGDHHTPGGGERVEGGDGGGRLPDSISCMARTRLSWPPDVV